MASSSACLIAKSCSILTCIATVLTVMLCCNRDLVEALDCSYPTTHWHTDCRLNPCLLKQPHEYLHVSATSERLFGKVARLESAGLSRNCVRHVAKDSKVVLPSLGVQVLQMLAVCGHVDACSTNYLHDGFGASLGTQLKGHGLGAGWAEGLLQLALPRAPRACQTSYGAWVTH